MILRAVIAGIAALLIGIEAVRFAAVGALYDRAPDKAAQIWSAHPDVALSSAMVAIASASKQGRAASPEVFAQVDAAAVKSPLSPQPFLVHGVEANLAGRPAQAEQAFLAAQRRDPRSLPAAYFLADHYFRSNSAAKGMRQVAVIGRLTPIGVQNAAPYLAAYAKDRANWPNLRALFHDEPGMGEAALRALATDPANADTILALADGPLRQPNSAWLQPLLTGLMKQGQAARARAIWASAAGVRLSPNTLLFDSDFTHTRPPPPFNWDLTSSAVGLAERRPGGSLHVMFYGQDNGVLARQLVLLAPGTYRLSMKLQGGSNHAEALHWLLLCAKDGRELARVDLSQASRGAALPIPADCPAQWLQLTGDSADMPQQSDVTISGLSLTRGGSGG